jgi:hypothetical protein
MTSRQRSDLLFAAQEELRGKFGIPPNLPFTEMSMNILLKVAKNMKVKVNKNDTPEQLADKIRDKYRNEFNNLLRKYRGGAKRKRSIKKGRKSIKKRGGAKKSIKKRVVKRKPKKSIKKSKKKVVRRRKK